MPKATQHCRSSPVLKASGLEEGRPESESGFVPSSLCDVGQFPLKLLRFSLAVKWGEWDLPHVVMVRIK